MKIYVQNQGIELGPYTRGEIFALLKAGTIDSDAVGRLEGESGWKPLNQVLASGTMAILTPEQIERQQAERPPAQVAVPTLFVPLQETVVELPEPPKKHWILPAALAAFLAIVSSWILIRTNSDSPESPSPTAEAKFVELPPAEPTTKKPVSSTPLPEPPSIVAQATPVGPKVAEIIAKPMPPEAEVEEPRIETAKSETLPNYFGVPAGKPEMALIAPLTPSPAASAPAATEQELRPSTTPSPTALPVTTPRPSTQVSTTPRGGFFTGKKDDFFTVGQIKFYSKSPPKGLRIIEVAKDKNNQKIEVFRPYLDVKLRTRENMRSSATYVKAYFYDGKDRLVSTEIEPYPISRNGEVRSYPKPALFKKRDWANVIFLLPKSLAKTTAWKALIVFGDENSADADVYPSGNFSGYDFAERQKVESPVFVERKEAMDPVVEYVVKTKNPKQPQITLFLRPPIGMTDAREARGVLALSALGNHVNDLKRRLQTVEAKDDLDWCFRFAEKEKLIILCWGSGRGLWDPGKNWDDLDKKAQKQVDENFAQISQAWVTGVKELSRKYGIPDHGYLLTGSSGAAQYAMRLALRQPQVFHAVYVHIPSSFDRPTPEANRVLWCLTTGELESGYERSLRFYEQCRRLGYPIVYKAIIGLGHAGSRYADKIGEAFFTWALSEKEARAKLEVELASSLSPIRRKWEQNPFQPWPDVYQTPPFIGDIVNQEMFPWAQREMVPPGLQVPLPDKAVADAWNAQKL